MTGTFERIPDYAPLLDAAGLTDIDAVFRWNRGQRLDKSGLEGWRQRWRIELLDGDRAHTFYMKRFDRPPLRRQWERWRQGHRTLSTAGVEWQNARHLARAGIAAVEPVACGQEMVGPWEIRSFILMKQVPGESLERWVPPNLPPPDQDADPHRRRALADRLARFVAAFHRAGFVHRDLYLSHVFITSDPIRQADSVEADAAVFRLIDLQRVFRPAWRRRRWVIKDLAALNFSTPIDRVGRRERLRFLCRYAREYSRFGSARQLAGPVWAKTARIARRYAVDLLAGPAGEV